MLPLYLKQDQLQVEILKNTSAVITTIDSTVKAGTILGSGSVFQAGTNWW